ncbi:MAG: hypothetical protein ACE5HN_03485 [Nitrospiria bacterium]
MSLRLRRFLTISGWVLLGIGSIRFYRVLRSHAEDPRFAPHLLVALLSLWIASSILRVGVQQKEVTRKGAISLIRSGSILLMIWSYRLYLSLKKMPQAEIPLHLYLAPFYIVFGTVVMVVGLRISRSLRKKAQQAVPSPGTSLPQTFVEDPADE